MTLQCPPPAELERLLQGDLADASGLEAHLAQCDRCRRRLDSLTPAIGANSSIPDGDLTLEYEAEWQQHHGFLQAALVGSLRERWNESGASHTPLPEVPGYHIECPLGEGGAGIVYRARHEKLQRSVALKTLRPGMLDRAEARGRFQREAEVLSRLRHPHVVQLFDFGEVRSARGPAVLYMVLELVEGGTLAEMVNRRPVPARTAAGLVEILARALQVVHQQGIIHRDLKPGNVLLQPAQTILESTGAESTATITALEARGHLADTGRLLDEYVPKITDFGLAKELTAGQSPWTQTRDVLGTPAYMAPEQAGEATVVTALADIYALGVILYELLTGLPPFRAADWVDVIVQVKEQEPVPPSRLLRGIPKELETTALKCLHKDPARRYPSAEALADDLRRFLDGQPILARPTGAWEKLWKWCRRNPGVAGLSASLFLLLVVGLTVTTWLFLVAEHRRGETQEAVNQLKHEQEQTKGALAAEKRRREQARQALEAITSEMVPEWLGRSSGLSPEQRKFLTRGLVLYQEFARETATDETSRVGVAEAQLRVAQFQRSLAQLAEARQSAAQAQQSWARLVTEFPANREYGRSLALAYWLQSVLLRDMGEKKEAEPHVRRALALNQQLLAAGDADPRTELQLCDCQNTLATILRQTGRLKDAEEQWRVLLPLRRQLATRFPHSAQHGIGLMWVHLNLALVLQQVDRLEEADKEIQAALAVAVPLAAEHAAGPECPQWLARCREVRGDIFVSRGELAKAEPEYRGSLAILTTLYRDYPGRPGIPNELAGVMIDLARMLRQQKQWEEARHWLEKAEPYHQVALATEPGNTAYRLFFRNNRQVLADCLVELGDHAAAERAIEQWIQFAVDPKNDNYHAATCLARCVAIVERNDKTTTEERQELATKYGASAVKLLRQAVAVGFEDVQALKQNPALDPLRDRPDFQQMLAEREASDRKQ
jgi:serine/threonine protein kinase